MAKASVLVSRPVAHRGLHVASAGRLENSLSAARAALDGGFGIECDVQLSADGEAMVFHDFVLDRLTRERGEVAKRGAADLGRLSLGGTADTIPTLKQLFDLVAGRQPLVVEIKSRFDGDMRLTTRTIALCRTYSGPLGVKSFDPRVVAELRRAAPELSRGIVAMAKYDGYDDYEKVTATEKHELANLLHFERTMPDFVSWRVGDLPSAAPYLCRTQLGLPLMTWTVRTPDDRARAAAHADQMVFEGFVP